MANYSPVALTFATIVYIGIVINIGLGVFNLIPLPPLDGSKIFANILPFNARQFFMKNEMVFHMIFLGIILFGLSSYIITPVINAVFSGINFVVGNLFNLIPI